MEHEKKQLEEELEDDEGKEKSARRKALTGEEIEKRVRNLIKTGKKKGFITYDDIDKAFPPDYDGFDTSLIEHIYEELEKKTRSTYRIQNQSKR